MQHRSDQRIIALHFDKVRTTDLQQAFKHLKDPYSMVRQHIELVYSGFTFPGARNGHRAVAYQHIIYFNAVLPGPPRTVMYRIMNDLTPHLLPIHITPGLQFLYIGD